MPLSSNDAFWAVGVPRTRKRKVFERKGVFRFFDLPPELRDMIYGHILTIPAWRICLSTGPLAGPRQMMGTRWKYRTAIMETSSQVEEECLDVLFSTNTWALVLDCLFEGGLGQLEDASQYLASLEPKRCRSLRHIEIQIYRAGCLHLAALVGFVRFFGSDSTSEIREGVIEYVWFKVGSVKTGITSLRYYRPEMDPYSGTPDLLRGLEKLGRGLRNGSHLSALAARRHVLDWLIATDDVVYEHAKAEMRGKLLTRRRLAQHRSWTKQTRARCLQVIKEEDA